LTSNVSAGDQRKRSWMGAVGARSGEKGCQLSAFIAEAHRPLPTTT
jgi:hypothetical protein